MAVEENIAIPTRTLTVSLRTVLVTVCAALLMAVIGTHDGLGQGNSVTSVSAREAARRIRGQRGRVNLVFLYGAYCPHCRKIFPQFVALAQRYSRQNVSVMAFATDKQVRAVEEFLGDDHLPFARLHIEPWEKGELAAAFKTAGIEIGEQFGVPLFAVIDGNGDVAGQWGGTGGLAKAEKWLESHHAGTS